jgi:hypothetical protein
MIRVGAILATVLVVLMTVAVLRVEIARRHHHISTLDWEAVEVDQRMRTLDVELARLRNPILIRQRVADLRLDDAVGSLTPAED